jgi:hypothetical protein
MLRSRFGGRTKRNPPAMPEKKPKAMASKERETGLQQHTDHAKIDRHRDRNTPNFEGKMLAFAPSDLNAIHNEGNCDEQCNRQEARACVLVHSTPNIGRPANKTLFIWNAKGFPALHPLRKACQFHCSQPSLAPCSAEPHKPQVLLRSPPRLAPKQGIDPVRSRFAAIYWASLRKVK